MRPNNYDLANTWIYVALRIVWPQGRRDKARSIRGLTRFGTLRYSALSIDDQTSVVNGAVAQLGERMTGSPKPTVLLIINN